MVEGATGRCAVKWGLTSMWDGWGTLNAKLKLLAGMLVARFYDDIRRFLCTSHDGGTAAGETNGRRGQ